MDTTLTADGGLTDGGASTGTIEGPQTGAVGEVDPNTGAVKSDGSSDGGQPTGETEGGQPQTGQRRKWSIQDEVKELRAQRRELREQVSSFGRMQEELAALRDQLNRQNQPGVAKTPPNFWQDPEGTIAQKLENLKDELRESITSEFHTTREQEYQAQALRQEQASATEFIRTQQGYHREDDEDLVEIIEGIPNRQHMSPQMVAEYAWMKLQQQRGVGDKGTLKHRAAGVQGQPPGQGFGRKTWSRQEFDAAVDMIEKNPHDPKHSELLKELEAAHKEGRVK